MDLRAAEDTLARIERAVESTYTPGVLRGLGAFGGLYAMPSGLREPVLVASTDGVGTKTMVAAALGAYESIGRDLVNHCIDDILVQGATPLFFLDYVASARLVPEVTARVVQGVADACRAANMALLGGETAEMPGFYQPGDYELVGFIVGLVDRPQLIDGSRVVAGDILLGLPSAGLHTNGYSLARRILFEQMKLGLRDRMPDDPQKRRVGEWLLAPHLSYLEPLRPLLGSPGLHAMAHITGGGLTDNLPRVLPEGLQAEIRFGSWEVPAPLRAMQEAGDVELEEMLRVFNMGLGMVLVVGRDELPQISRQLAAANQRALPIGRIAPGTAGVVYDLGLTGPDEPVV